MDEEKLKVYIVTDEDSHLYEVYYAKKPLTFIENFKNLNECISFCKERDFVITDKFE